jgi:phage protein U
MLRLTGDTEFSFETSSAAYQRYVFTRGSRWPEQERLGRTPALQHVGLSTAEMTLDGVIYPGVMGGLQEDLRKLRGLCLADKPFQMVTGTGRVCGFWAVPEVSDTRTVFLDNGLPRKVEFTLKLKYYGSDYQGGEGNIDGATNILAAVSQGITPPASSVGLENLPVISSASNYAEVAAIAAAAGNMAGAAACPAREALYYAANPLALAGLAMDAVLPAECLQGAKEIAQAARSVLAVGERVFDAVSAVSALAYAGPGAGSQRLNAVAAALRQNLLYTRDTARLTAYGMDARSRTLVGTGRTFERIPERQNAAAMYFDTSARAARMRDACRRLDQDSSLILERFR